MKTWLTNILRWPWVGTAPKSGYAAPNTPRFVPDGRLFGALDEVLDIALWLRAFNDPEAAHARARPAWQEERRSRRSRRPTMTSSMAASKEISERTGTRHARKSPDAGGSIRARVSLSPPGGGWRRLGKLVLKRSPRLHVPMTGEFSKGNRNLQRSRCV